MAGHGVEDDPSLKGISRYFNSQTNRGRANVSFPSPSSRSGSRGGEEGHEKYSVVFALHVFVSYYPALTKPFDAIKSQVIRPLQFDRKSTCCFCFTMAGDSSVDESQLKGLSKYFNSQTNRGRANTAKATYAVMGVFILYLTLKPKSKK
ncbi:putative stretch regulated skeletal muscle protein [Operophtera brumata]|uniref:Putative stretch regulated skeletal muscle protein n=1 Tax=Operophtera brumata TaxID=104452 RepID=A0A0L7KVU8_OPEBR|nr:putative stretch regulated skeletal muscle protein [Operophtera brumata]